MNAHPYAEAGVTPDMPIYAAWMALDLLADLLDAGPVFRDEVDIPCSCGDPSHVDALPANEAREAIRAGLLAARDLLTAEDPEAMSKPFPIVTDLAIGSGIGMNLDGLSAAVSLELFDDHGRLTQVSITDPVMIERLASGLPAAMLDARALLEGERP